MRVVRVRDFESPYGMTPEELAAYRRRFAMLFADDSRTRRGGLGQVTYVSNAVGEEFALKTLVMPTIQPGEPDEAFAARCKIAVEAFREEYENQRSLSGFKGFPRLYGYAYVGDQPAIIMEWVEGETLGRVRRRLALDDAGRLSPLVVARLGRDLFDLLVRLDLVQGGFVHRDISPANVMIRTSHLSVEDQAVEGAFDLCLIDFGSSLALDTARASSFTTRHAVLRRATADYAAPEMLTDDLPHLLQMRASASIDVYAAASVLYELLDGGLPFDLHAEGAPSPFRVKTDHAPRRAETAHGAGAHMAQLLAHEPEVAIAAGQVSLDLQLAPDAPELQQAIEHVDGQLIELLMPCLSSEQSRRPSAESVRDGMDAFCKNYAANIARSLHGQSLLSCSGPATWREGVSPYAVNRVLTHAGKALGWIMLLLLAAGTSILLDGVCVWANLGIAWVRFALSVPLIVAAVLLPALAGQLGMWRRRGTTVGFVRGTVLLAACALATAVLCANTLVDGMPSPAPLLGSVFASTAAGWFLLVMDYAMTVVPAIRSRQRRPLPESLKERWGRTLGTAAAPAAALTALAQPTAAAQSTDAPTAADAPTSAAQSTVQAAQDDDRDTLEVSDAVDDGE